MFFRISVTGLLALKVLIISCQHTETQSISVQKCNEYQQAVYVPANDKKSVSKCAVDAVPMIAGGTETRQGEFPHMALLGYQIGDEVKWHCGGTLISDEYVLTAAHCVTTKEKPKYVRLGAHHLDRNADKEDHTLEINVTEIIPHPAYDDHSWYNDIALVRLQRKITFTPYIRPLCLPTAAVPIASKATATGWGRTRFSATASSTLRKVDLEIFTNAKCNETYSSRKLVNGIVETQLCAGSRIDEKDTCRGDGGGPLQIDHPSNYCMFTIIGITSFGPAICGVHNVPSGFTRVSSFIPWVERIVWPAEFEEWTNNQ